MKKALLTLAIGFTASIGMATAGEVKLPGTVSWTAYNVGSSGYNQSVAIGKALQDSYGVTLRVVPAKNDVSRVVPVRQGRINFSAAGSGVFYAVEGVLGWAKEGLGPQQLHLTMSASGKNCLALGTATDANIKTAADLKGKRMPWVLGSPSLQTNVTAFLAYGGLTWSDVEKVEVANFGAAWKAMVNDQVDAMTTFTTSGGVKELEASPRGLTWLSTPHDEAENWERMQKVAPHFAKRIATAGAGLSADNPLECSGFPYPILVTDQGQDADLVYNMAKAISEQVPNFVAAEPTASGWADDRQNFTWVLPYHEGAVKFWKEKGLWSAESQAHNDMLMKRQSILAETWKAFADQKGDIKDAWMAARSAALKGAGLNPVWEK